MNKYFKIFLFSIVIVLITIGCDSPKNKNTASYFGGQIVNPKSTKVYFLKNEKYLDSTTLGLKNNFSFEFKDLKSGLYTFSHGNEYQYVFFKAQDSIMIRLNTWDFDESLVFTGKGAERNNFLMNLFLTNEEEDKFFESFYELSVKDFNNKIDSIIKIKTTLYNQFKSNTKENSEYFDKLVNVAIYYPLYRKKEDFPLIHKGKLKKSYPVIESSFYAYRDLINLNDNSLVYFYPYRNYINSYLHHKAFEKKEKYPETNIAISVLENITTSIQQKELRNFFLYRIISDSFFRRYNLTEEQRRQALAIFYKNCDDDEKLKEIKLLAFDFSNIKKGAKLFDFKVINTDGKIISSSYLFKNKKTVLYFWSKKLINANNLSRRVLYLQKQYPKLNFIGINVDDSKDKWLKSTVFNTLISKNQFQLAEQCVMRNFITAKTPRIILLNDSAIVKNGFTVFWAKNFNKELAFLEKN